MSRIQNKEVYATLCLQVCLECPNNEIDVVFLVEASQAMGDKMKARQNPAPAPLRPRTTPFL